MALYPWLESVLEEQYRPVCRLRKTERNEIVLLEQKERHVRIVKRIFAGSQSSTLTYSNSASEPV